MTLTVSALVSRSNFRCQPNGSSVALIGSLNGGGNKEPFGLIMGRSISVACCWNGLKKTCYHLNDEIRLTIAVADYRRNADGTIEVLKTGERNEKCYMCSGKLDKQKVCESI